MTEPARLASVHLEDLAIISMKTLPGVGPLSLYPDLDAAMRSKLRARIKQLSRYDWPANLTDDPLLRRGYTLRQCFRLVSALALVDAYLGPSTAVAIAANNELAIMRSILRAIRADESPPANDLMAVFIAGDLWQLAEADGFVAAEPTRLRWIERRSLNDLWTAEHDLEVPGQRVVIDLARITRVAWRWIHARRLMPSDAFDVFSDEITERDADPSYQHLSMRTTRR